MVDSDKIYLKKKELKEMYMEAAVVINKGKIKEPECRNEHEDSFF